MRFFTASLASAPEVRTSGCYGHENERQEWVQPNDLWQGILYRHPGSFTLNGFTFDFQQWTLVVVPPGARCEVFNLGEPSFIYSYFSFQPVVSERDLMALPLHCNLGEDGRFWDLNFRRALGKLQFTRTGVQAVVGALLWAVAEPAHVARRNVYIDAAEKLIEERLNEDLRVSHLARELSISQSQLCRLFLSEHGRTPLQYIRDRKAQLAHQLLTGTTHPIKQVAVACGFQDLHSFNRFVRDRLGVSPRAVRGGREEIDIFRVKE